MRERERHNQRELKQPEQPSAPVGSGQSLNKNQTAAERFLAASDDAINRALSTNSEDFLASKTQEGGQ